MLDSSYPNWRGRTILLTRPEPQNEQYAEALQRIGAQTICLPAIEIFPREDKAGLQQAMLHLANCHSVIFVSPNAVSIGRHLLSPELLRHHGILAAAIGDGGRSALGEAGYSNIIAPQQGFDSEALLALPTFAQELTRCKSVIICGGVGGRELLGEELTQRGALIIPLRCYERRPGRGDSTELVHKLRSKQLDLSLLTSSEACTNLRAMLVTADWQLLCQRPVVVTHQRIHETAADAGFQNIIQSSPGIAALFDVVEQYFATHH